MTSVVNTQVFAHYVLNVADTAHADGEADALWCGDAGIVQVVRADGTQIAFTVVAGTLLPVKHTRIESTGTTATEALMVAMYTRKP